MRYLTKSRFKLGLECPSKLYYTNKESVYANTKKDDSFLMALASGGFQVEELARLHFPKGILIEDLQDDSAYNYREKVDQTYELLKREKVVIFEAAFLYENLFIRVDIIEKDGDNIKLIEVKAKSFSSSKPEEIKFSSEWQFYLFDVAFQKYVIEHAFPQFNVFPFLMLADKDKKTTVDGLNQLFRITKRANNRTGIKKVDEVLNHLDIREASVLSQVDISELISTIYSGENRILKDYEFEDIIKILAKAYQEDKYLGSKLDLMACKKCEFKTDEKSSGKKSGYKECFTKKFAWKDEEFNSPNVFEIWDFRGWKKLEKENLVLLKDIDDSLFGDNKSVEGKLSRVDRQLTQKSKALDNDTMPYVLQNSLKDELNSWTFPLHFIDFEASTVALPFYKGQRPYEKVVFQFSHHIYHENGTITHASEYINVTAGHFPNFDFVRQLKSALDDQKGTVFQFSNYENTTLNQIKRQLEDSQEMDREELIAFIKTLAEPPKGKDYIGERWVPSRGMVDLCEVIKDYYYNPYTKGSNSIKFVLPAIFETSKFIREKYSKPLSELDLSSRNFPSNHVWLLEKERKVVDPYKNLDKPFEEWDEEFERLSDIEEINNGGAALTAYGLTQYYDMDEKERDAIRKSLLKYCELDTLAMVMVYEHLKELCTL
jgi:hypothetical protein